MAEYPYQEDQLETWTRRYWERCVRGEEIARWNYYLGHEEGNQRQSFGDPPKPLLRIEMECAEYKKRLPERKPLTTLVLLVGTSFEPLLQSVWAYQPTRLVAVVTHFYGDRERTSKNHITGSKHWGDLRRFIERLGRDALQMPGIADLKTVEDTPMDVFNHLREQLRSDLVDSNKHIVIDITGAKKTMVAGAYLFAAYYSRAEISYVDFDRWDEGESKPYGYTCRIAGVRNPMREWALREWQSVEEQYSKRNFAAAIDVLAKIEVPGYEETIKRLYVYLEVCNAWDTGDLLWAKQRAATLPEDLRDSLPLAVEELGESWPDPAGQYESMLSEKFLLAPHALMIYARDEIARAKRLASRDVRPNYREAFARAYAVYETMIKARALVLFDKGYWECDVQGATYKSNALPDNHKQGVTTWMLYEMQTRDAKPLLGLRQPQHNHSCNYKDNNGTKVKVKINPIQSSANVNVPSNIYEQDEDMLRKHRNLITHTYVPVTKELAEHAIKQAEAYMNEYKDGWGKLADDQFDPSEVFEDTVFDVPDWTILKEKCGLNFLL